MLRINLTTTRIRSYLLLAPKSRRVIHELAENSFAIFAILSRVEDVLMPELVYFRRWWRNEILWSLVR